MVIRIQESICMFARAVALCHFHAGLYANVPVLHLQLTDWVGWIAITERAQKRTPHLENFRQRKEAIGNKFTRKVLEIKQTSGIITSCMKTLISRKCGENISRRSQWPKQLESLAERKSWPRQTPKVIYGLSSKIQPPKLPPFLIWKSATHTQGKVSTGTRKESATCISPTSDPRATHRDWCRVTTAMGVHHKTTGCSYDWTNCFIFRIG